MYCINIQRHVLSIVRMRSRSMSVVDTPTKFSFQGRVSHKIMNIINFTISVKVNKTHTIGKRSLYGLSLVVILT